MSLLRVLVPTAPDYDAEIDRLTRRASVIPQEIDERVRVIVDDVRARGDEAVREYTERFEKRRPEALEISRERWDAEAAKVDPKVRSALERAAARIRAFHEKQREAGYEIDEPGVRMALRVEPLARVGLYVPGGTARYPSSVLMTAVPARVAGVLEVVMVTPGASPETLAAAQVAEVDRVFEIGGAQAVAALAYGTESVPRVDKIVGPGNVYVAAAKRIVFGDVDIDAVAGPSEVLVLVDETADPAIAASDLLAQAEHDAEAYPSSSRPRRRWPAPSLPRSSASSPPCLAAPSPSRPWPSRAWPSSPAISAAAVRLANRFAPEHIGVHVRDARHVAGSLRTLGGHLRRLVLAGGRRATTWPGRTTCCRRAAPRATARRWASTTS